MSAILKEYNESPEELYKAKRNNWIRSGFFNKAQLSGLMTSSLDEAKSVSSLCESKGIKILTPDMSEYPCRLRALPDYPLVLYIWGDMPDIDNEVFISIVGTRTSTDYGRRMAYNLAYMLSKAGAIITSGAAKGIDSYSHKGALDAGGRTVAFLGCGIGYGYLMENKALRKEISRNGAVVSEFPPYYPASRITFPIRNRLISGVSLGTVVVEAGAKSGSLITADLALRQGRDVFAVPGNVGNAAHYGVHRLIRDGAKQVVCPMDVLEEYASFFPHKLNLEHSEIGIGDFKRDIYEKKYENTNKKLSKEEYIYYRGRVDLAGFKINKLITKEESGGSRDNDPAELNLSETAKRIYDLLNVNAAHVDEICDKLSLAPNAALSALTELEINGLAQASGGRNFKLV